MSEEDQTLIIKAQLAERADRYDDMAKYMKEYVEKAGDQIRDEARNLLSVAFKNTIGTRRSAWRMLKSEEARTTDTDDATSAKKKEILKSYMEQVEAELTHIINDVLVLIDNHLLKHSSNSDERKVFYHKMKGDYCRYKAEFSKGADKEEATEMSLNAYKEATACSENLEPTNSTRLGLSLNFSVFYYEIQDSPEKACAVAKKAFDEAIADLDQVAEDKYKDSTLIMQLLRDNLTLWTADKGGDDEDDDK